MFQLVLFENSREREHSIILYNMCMYMYGYNVSGYHGKGGKRVLVREGVVGGTIQRADGGAYLVRVF